MHCGSRLLARPASESGRSVGDAYDDALCESFFATLECERLDRERFRTPAEARRALFDYIEGWYNPRRRHSALGYESPLRYERTHAASGLRAAAPEKSSAVQPPGSTLTEGGAISVSRQVGGLKDVDTAVTGGLRAFTRFGSARNRTREGSKGV